MATAEYYRQQAEALRKLAKASTEPDVAFAYNLRAVEYDHLAEESEAQVQQHGTQPLPAPDAPQHQPVRQQQQVQPKKGH